LKFRGLGAVGFAHARSRYVQKLKSCRLAVVITEEAAESLTAPYRSGCVADHLVWCDDPIAETLMISFKVVMRTELLN
jgi:hypothetical protein